MVQRRVLAIDIGAESGRAVLGTLEHDQLVTGEIHRFPNGFVEMAGRHYTDLPALVQASRSSIARASDVPLDSVAVDTWAVDFGLLDRAGEFVSIPHGYRDRWTMETIEAVQAARPGIDVFGSTGIHTMRINTLFQLWALREQSPWALDSAVRLLMVPDLIAYGLTGVATNELTIASTTQLFDVSTRTWAWSFIDELGFPRRLFHDVVEPGTTIGPVGNDEHAPQMVATASHDTAAAVAGAVDVRPGTAFVSTGSFCIVGAELEQPVINEPARTANLSNEIGVSGRTRLLKDVVGLWMLAESQRQWQREGREFTYEELLTGAAAMAPLRYVFDTDEPSLLLPGDMPDRISRLCGATQALDPATVTRSIVDSIALKVRLCIDQLEVATESRFDRLTLVGGGVRNHLLCQAVADACGRPLTAGPEEATALGNIMVQLMVSGDIGSLEEGRELVARTTQRREFEPGDQQRWQDAYGRYGGRLAESPNA